LVDGYKLYTAVPLMYLSGVYRLLCTNNFAKEKGLGYILEILFSVVLLLLQVFNNDGLSPDPVKNIFTTNDLFIKTNIYLKFAALLDLTVELIIFII
jgi:hypothetical protein